MGLALGPAASRLGSERSRGRHGNALQWHFGLDAHDGAAVLDWEDRVELKLMTLWRRNDGAVGLDKLKLCDAAVDPRRKLSNVLFIFADRLTRVVLGYRFFRLAGEARASLAQHWGDDPHFGRPAIFIEARESGQQSAPAYYLSAAWLETWVLPASVGSAGLFPFDPRWWSEVRGAHSGRAPLLTVVPPGAPAARCGRCGAPMSFEVDRLASQGWAPARHGMPVDGPCGLRGHVAVDGARLPRAHGCSLAEQVSALEQRPGAEEIRLTDRVPEPDDHEH